MTPGDHILVAVRIIIVGDDQNAGHDRDDRDCRDQEAASGFVALTGDGRRALFDPERRSR